MQSVGHEYRSDIDGLRAIAVGAVVIYHAFPGLLHGGFLGVDIFFVISGYLISQTIFVDLANGRFSLIDFYSRRARRILPTLLIVCASCLVFGWIDLLPVEFVQLSQHTLASVLFVQNFVLYNEVGYFDVAAEAKPLLHLWSLSVEEQFYIAFPLAMLVLLRLRLPRYWVLGLAAVASFAACVWVVGYNQSAAFYLPQFRTWELLVGTILAVAVERRPRVGPAWMAEACSVGGLALLGLGFLLTTKERAHPGIYTLMSVVGTAALIWAGEKATINRFFLSNPVMVWGGSISYPLYMWHWPILAFGQIIDPAFMTWRVEAICIGISVVLSWLTLILVERPVRFSSIFTLRQKASALMAASVAIGAFGIAVFAQNGLASRSTIAQLASFNEQISWTYSTNDTCLDNFDYPGRKGAWWFCAAGGTEPKVLLLGNSFANHLYPGLGDKFGAENFISIGACDPAYGVDFGEVADELKELSPCSGRAALHEADFINQFVQRQESLEYVIINTFFANFGEGGNYLPRGNPTNQQPLVIYDEPESATRTSFENYFAGLSKRILFLEGQGLKVILFAPKPELGTNIRKCVGRTIQFHPPEDCSVDEAVALASQVKVREGVALLQAEHPAMKVFDQFPTFCREGKCYFYEKTPVLRDATHLSAYGSMLLADNFEKWVQDQDPDFIRVLSSAGSDVAGIR